MTDAQKHFFDIGHVIKPSESGNYVRLPAYQALASELHRLRFAKASSPTLVTNPNKPQDDYHSAQSQ